MRHRSPDRAPRQSNSKELRNKLRIILGFRPGNIEIYQAALIHRSATIHIDNSHINNERLEFLGDSILDAVLSDYLYQLYPDDDEGDLTQRRSRIVNRELLNNLALSTGIDKLLVSNIQNNHTTRNLYGDAMEALVGAVYLDRGYRQTRKFILRFLNTNLNLEELVNHDTDYKSHVYQWAQKMRKQIQFNYSEQRAYNEEETIFRVSLLVDHELYGEGSGISKKEAEQDASKMAWKKIKRSGYFE